MTSNSKVIKCNNCNIVICEVLAYVQNKMDVMDEESLMRLCVTSFSEEEIEAAKNLLFDSITTTRRKISRKREGKSQRDLADIITLFKETDPELVPIFVARELHKLPPISFDHLDASKLLKDILLLQNELKIIKDSYVTHKQLDDLKFHIEQSKHQTLDCTITDLPHNTEKQNIAMTQSLAGCREQSDDTPSLSYAECINRSLALSHTSTRVEASTAVSTQVQRKRANPERPSVVPETARSISQAISGSEKIQPDKEEKNGWTIVQKKKPKYKFAGSRGKAASDVDMKFKAAEINIPLFISRVAKEVTDSDIADYILSKTQTAVTIKKIIMQKERNYNAFKIFVPHHKLAMFLDDSLWPEGVSFRRFVYFNKTKKAENNVVNSDVIQNN